MIVVICTVPEKGKTGEKIAKTLVEENLAACVSILDAEKSIYKWKGKTIEEPERVLVIKAKKGNWGKIREKIISMHPHSTPEIISLKTDNVAEPYLKWVYGKQK